MSLWELTDISCDHLVRGMAEQILLGTPFFSGSTLSFSHQIFPIHLILQCKLPYLSTALSSPPPCCASRSIKRNWKRIPPQVKGVVLLATMHVVCTCNLHFETVISISFIFFLLFFIVIFSLSPLHVFFPSLSFKILSRPVIVQFCSYLILFYSVFWGRANVSRLVK